jgi:peptidoglycan/LPS O-acetylase OafA/YrhL
MRVPVGAGGADPVKLDYLPRLDGVRALAVGGVLVTHFMWFLEPIQTMELGRTGVRLFFVLSGFLITRILLDYRSRMSVGEAARHFYWRRFLRLAPPFYLAVTVALILNLANMREDWPWHVFYLSNFLLAARGSVEPVGHLWSLAVEEQFYLVWFAVVV